MPYMISILLLIIIIIYYNYYQEIGSRLSFSHLHEDLLNIMYTIFIILS